MDNLGLGEAAAVQRTWQNHGAAAELKTYAGPAGRALGTFYLCVTRAGEAPASPPGEGAACFLGAHPRPWRVVKAGSDSLIWLDDFVAGETVGISDQIHLVASLPLGSDVESLRIRAAVADLRVRIVTAGDKRETERPTFQTGPLMDAPYDQLVLPFVAGHEGPAQRAWLYAIVTPSWVAATRFGARLAGRSGTEIIADQPSTTPDAATFDAGLKATVDGPARPPPAHPCRPSRSLLMAAAFDRALGLTQTSDALDKLAETLASTVAGAQLALTILPHVTPDNARHALLTRLDLDASSAVRPTLDRARAAVAIDRGQLPRASLFAHAGGSSGSGEVDGLQARLALARGQAGQAADILSACATDPKCPRPLVETLVQALLDIGLVADARTAITTHPEAFPGGETSALWLRAFAGPNDAKRVKARLRAQADDAPTRALLRIASARGHLVAGDRAGAEAELAKLKTPESPTGWIVPAGTRVQLAELYIDLGLLDVARGIVTWTLAQSPADPWVRALDDQLRARDGDDGALPRAAIAVLADLSDDLSALFAAPPGDLPVLSEMPSRAPAGGWEILSEQLFVRVSDDGSATRLGRRILRRGADDVGTPPLAALRWPWDPSRVSQELVRAVVHQPRGDKPPGTRAAFVSRPLRGVTIEAPERTQVGLYYDELELVIPWTGVPPGALVELVWLVTPVGQPFPGYFEFNEYLSSRVPRGAFDLIISAPLALTITHRVIQAPGVSLAITEDRQVKDDRSVLTLSVRDDRGLAPEPFAPPHPEIGAVLVATTSPSWPALGAFYADLMRSQARLTDEMREAVKAIVAANRGRSGEPHEAAITRDLAALVAQRVRYVAMEFGVHGYKPYRTEDVWARRFGDCKDQALLLVTLLNAAGIEAEPVLVRTRRLGHIGTWDEPPPPILALFDHAIVHLKSRDRYVDPTTIHHGFDVLAPDNLGADAFILPWGPDREGRLTRIPSGVATRNRVDGNFSVLLDASGGAIIHGRVAYSGTQAGAWRSRLANEATRDQLVQTMIGSTFRGFVLARFTVSGLDPDASQLRIVFEGEVQQLAQREAGGLRVATPLPLGGQRARVGEVKGRTMPFHLGTPGIGSFEVAWTLPAGHVIATVPAGLVRESPRLRAAVEWRAPPATGEGPRTLTGRVELGFLAEAVTPAELPAFTADLEALDRAIASPLVLIREAPSLPGGGQ